MAKGGCGRAWTHALLGVAVHRCVAGCRRSTVEASAQSLVYLAACTRSPCHLHSLTQGKKKPSLVDRLRQAFTKSECRGSPLSMWEEGGPSCSADAPGAMSNQAAEAHTRQAVRLGMQAFSLPCVLPWARPAACWPPCPPPGAPSFACAACRQPAAPRPVVPVGALGDVGAVQHPRAAAL